MLELHEADALALAATALAGWRHNDELVVHRAQEHSRAWIVSYVTKRYLTSLDWRDLPVGATPIVIEKATGTAHVYGSGPVEYQQFLTWQDGARPATGGSAGRAT